MANQFSSKMFLVNQWGNTLHEAWLYHVAQGKSSETLAVGDLPNNSTSPGQPITYYEGVHDLWTVTFVDQEGQVWGSDANVNDGLPNENIPSVMVTVVGGSTPVMYIDFTGDKTEKYSLTRRA
jgi:hypothetical protein